ncbi:hypothetical protein B566_EDAN000846 [Ephemera danica]|nr:hypothetical protein B566_EDAN000846 [Ephemera danica]
MTVLIIATTHLIVEGEKFDTVTEVLLIKLIQADVWQTEVDRRERRRCFRGVPPSCDVGPADTAEFVPWLKMFFPLPSWYASLDIKFLLVQHWNVLSTCQGDPERVEIRCPPRQAHTGQLSATMYLDQKGVGFDPLDHFKRRKLGWQQNSSDVALRNT